MIATPTGKSISTNELLNDDQADLSSNFSEKGMSRREINTLLRETYASNTLQDFPKPAKHPILERIADLAERFLGAVAPKAQEADDLAEITREAFPLAKTAQNWSREI